MHNNGFSVKHLPPSDFLLLLRRYATRQKHFLRHAVLHAADGFIFCDGKVGKNRVVSNVRGIAIPVDVHRPLKATQICMTSPNVFCLRAAAPNCIEEGFPEVLTKQCIHDCLQEPYRQVGIARLFQYRLICVYYLQVFQLTVDIETIL